MGKEKCSFKIHKSERSETQPQYNFLSCSNIVKNIADNNAAVLKTSLSESDCCKVNNSDLVHTFNILKVNLQKSSNFDNISKENANFKTAVTGKEHNCINHKCVTTQNSLIGESTSCSNVDKRIGDTAENNLMGVSDNMKCCRDANGAVTTAVDENRCQSEVNYNCKYHATFDFDKNRCQTEASHVCADEKIFEHENEELKNKILNYVLTKKSFVKQLKYLNSVYRTRLEEIDALSKNYLELRVDIYKEWELSLEKLYNDTFQILYNMRLDISDHLKNEKLQAEKDKISVQLKKEQLQPKEDKICDQLKNEKLQPEKDKISAQLKNEKLQAEKHKISVQLKKEKLQPEKDKISDQLKNEKLRAQKDKISVQLKNEKLQAEKDKKSVQLKKEKLQPKEDKISDQLKKEKLQPEDEKEESEEMKRYLRNISELITVYRAAYKSGVWPFKYDSETFDKGDLDSDK